MGKRIKPPERSFGQVERAVARARQRLLDERAADGTWRSRFDLYAFPAALFIIMLRTTGLINRPGSARDELALARHMLDQVNEDGGFFKFPGSPSCRGVTRAAVLSLQLVLGDVTPIHRPSDWYRRNQILDESLANRIRAQLKRAGQFLDQKRFFPDLFELDHRFFPEMFEPYIREEKKMSVLITLQLRLLTKTTLVPALAILGRQFNRMIRRVVPAVAILESTMRSAADGGRLKRREQSERLAGLIISQQNENGGWFYNAVYPIINIMALHESGLAGADRAIRRGHDHLRRRLFPVPGGGMAINLVDCDLQNTVQGAFSYLRIKGHRAGDRWIRPSLEYLLNAQAGDGGFAWNGEAGKDTDNDSTAMAMLFLIQARSTARGKTKARLEHSIRLGLRFLLANQNLSGGWSVWDRNGFGCRRGSLPVWQQMFFDIPTPDVSGRVLAALQHTGLTAADEPFRRGLVFFLRTQRRNGSWWSRWWAGYICGTCTILLVLVDLGIDAHVVPGSGRLMQRLHRAAHRGLGFLFGHQNPDGGWGETIRADSRRRWAGIGPSSPIYTALVVLTLLRFGFKPDHEAVGRGLNYLLTSQDERGGWPAQETVFSFFSRSFYYQYPFHGLILPLNALEDSLVGWGQRFDSKALGKDSISKKERRLKSESRAGSGSGNRCN